MRPQEVGHVICITPAALPFLQNDKEVSILKMNELRELK
jgi:hypothetical protein